MALAIGAAVFSQITATSHWAASPSFHLSMGRSALGNTVPLFRGKVWVFGEVAGHELEDAPSKTIDVYDPETQQWSISQQQLPLTPSGYLHAVTYNDAIFVALAYGRAVQFDGHQWSDELELPYQDSNAPHLAVFRANNDDKEYLYAFFSAISEYRVQRFDGNQWEEVPRTPFDRDWDICTAVVDGAMFVIGGDGVASWDGMDWTHQDSMLRPRSGHNAAVFDGRMYIIGGRGSDGFEDSIEVGSVMEGAVTWTLLQGSEWSMPSPRTGMAGVIVDGSWWGIGGYSNGGINNGAITAFNPLSPPQIPGSTNSTHIMMV